MRFKCSQSILFICLAALFLPACGSPPAGDGINVVVELPTQAVAAAETVVELQSTVDAMSGTIDELAQEAQPTPLVAINEATPAPTLATENTLVVEAPTTQPLAPTSPPPAPVQTEVIVVTDMNSLQARMSSAVPDENGQVIITLNQDELNAAIQTADSISQNDAISNVSIRFTSGLMIFEADVTQPRNGRLSAQFIPYVANHALQFDLVSVSLDENTLPPAGASSIESALNNSLGSAMSQLPGNVLLVDVIVGEGTLTIVGQVQS